MPSVDSLVRDNRRPFTPELRGTNSDEVPLAVEAMVRVVKRHFCVRMRDASHRPERRTPGRCDPQARHWLTAASMDFAHSGSVSNYEAHRALGRRAHWRDSVAHEDLRTSIYASERPLPECRTSALRISEWLGWVVLVRWLELWRSEAACLSPQHKKQILCPHTPPLPRRGSTARAVSSIGGKVAPIRPWRRCWSGRCQ
jgi:hypothetical protein